MYFLEGITHRPCPLPGLFPTDACSFLPIIRRILYPNVPRERKEIEKESNI